MDNVEFLLHRGAAGAAEAAGEEEEEERHGGRQPAAHRDSEMDISRSAGRHAGGWSKALQRTGRQGNEGLSSPDWPQKRISLH